MKNFFKCRCYYINNFYIPDLDLHVAYADTNSLRHNLRTQLQTRQLTEEEVDNYCTKVEKERNRRLTYDKDSAHRREVIQEQYQPLHKEIYNLKETFLSGTFQQIVRLCESKDVSLDMLKEYAFEDLGQRIYSFSVFTEEFCKLFVEEIEHFEKSDLPKGRPNTMNNYGLLLDEMGFYEHFITPLREKYLAPICKLLYPDLGGENLDSHKAFVVAYKINQDLDLGTHFDNSEVTINISLGKNFEGGSLYFGKMREEYQTDRNYKECVHKSSYGLLHRGQHIHGALPIDDGERYNMIIWMRSSKVRNNKCPMCDCKPVLVPSAGFADGFTEETVNLCQLT